MKALQKFSKEYLDQCRELKPDEIIAFLENFRELIAGQRQGKSRLISIKIPEPLLEAFRTKARLVKIPYQTQIKHLMIEWLNR